MNKIFLVFIAVLSAPWISLTPGWAAQSCPNTVDYTDSTYGARVRQIRKPDGHEHNLYYNRNPWNANNTYMVGITEDLDHTDWRVVLSDGNGCFIKELFPISQYNWQVVWDRHDPEVFYTWKGPNLYKYNVSTGAAKVLKSFTPLRLTPNGLSLNQAGDRILAITAGNVIRSYQLPDMTDERSFTVPGLPEKCDMRNVRYIGYRDYIAIGCRNQEGVGTLIYKDTGVLFHAFDFGFGHSDFSPDGQWAYGKMWEGKRRGGSPLEIHVVNLDGSKDRVVYSVPQHEAAHVQSFHISWPDRVNNWFIVSFFPSARNPPLAYAPLLDEILLITTSGERKFLARTETSIGGRQEFWAQPLASPSSDGTRISFNSNRSGTFDQYILWVPSDLHYSKVASPFSPRSTR